MEAAWTAYTTAKTGASIRSKNVSFSDNEGITHYAYINQFGIAKPFTSLTDYSTTLSNQSCGIGSTVVLDDRSWSTIAYPKGSNMILGTTCGYENMYITSSFPTDISGMAHLGKVGYVDVDNVYHPIPPTYLNTYSSATSSHFFGTTMSSCIRGSTIRFGDSIHIRYENIYAKVNSTTSNLKPHAVGTTFYIKNPSNTSSTSNVTYGSNFILTTDKDVSKPAVVLNDTTLQLDTPATLAGATFTFIKSGDLLNTSAVTYGDTLMINDISNNKFVIAPTTADQANFYVGATGSILSIIHPVFGPSCDIQTLKNGCTSSPNCLGVVHSESDNKWQMMSLDDVYTENLDQTSNIYLRDLSFNMSNSINCPVNKTIHSVPSSRMEFPYGKELTSGCPYVPKFNVPTYDDYVTEFDTKWSSMTVPGNDDISGNRIKLEGVTATVKTAWNTYNDAFDSLWEKNDSTKGIDYTLEQRIEDSLVLDEHYKALAILWGIISISVISIIIFRPNN